LLNFCFFLCFFGFFPDFLIHFFSIFELLNILFCFVFFVEFVPFCPVFFFRFFFKCEFSRIFHFLFFLARIATFRSSPLKSIPGLFND
jgi:hypothetical protein